MKRWKFFFVDIDGTEVTVLARAIVWSTTEQMFQTMEKVDGYLNHINDAWCQRLTANV